VTLRRSPEISKEVDPRVDFSSWPLRYGCVGDNTEHSLGVRLTVNTSSRNSEEGGLSWLGRQGKMSELQLDFQEVRRKC